MIRALKCLYKRSGRVENLNLYSVGKSADIRSLDVTDTRVLTEIENHIRERILSQPELHNASIVAYGRLRFDSDVWLQYRAEKLLLRISAEDSIKEFLSGNSCGSAFVDQLLGLAKDMMAENEELKEFVGRFREKITFYVGEAELLYRPKLLDRFFKGRRFDDAIETFWKMYREIRDIFPRDEVLALVRASSVEFEEIGKGKIAARFCQTLDDVEVDGREVLRDVERIVDGVLREKGIRKEW